MGKFNRLHIVAAGLGLMLTAFSSAFFPNDKEEIGFPATAFEYAKMVEPELGVPPRVDLGEGVELPLHVDGV
jgi:hypothetical protein